MQRKRVTFLGVFGAGNLGNECTLEAAIEQARRQWPDAVFNCIATYPDDTCSLHNMPAFPLQAPHCLHEIPSRRFALARRISRIVFMRLPLELAHTTRGLRVAMATDVLIVAGTGIVGDYLTGPFGWPYDLFKWSLLAACCRAKVLFLGVGVGPIHHPLSRFLIKTSLRLASYRSYRDYASREYLEKIGFRTRGDGVCPDLVFGLSKRLNAPSDAPARKRIVVGIGIKDYYGAAQGMAADAHGAYLTTMVEFVSWLGERGYGVRLLIGDLRYDTKVRQDLIGRIKSTAKAELVVCEAMPTVEELRRQLADTDVVVSPRLHNLILALLLNKPVLALSDHPKLDSLMSGLELDRYCLPLKELTTDDLRRTFLALESEIEKMRPYIREKVKEYQMALCKEFAIASAHAGG